MERAVICLVKNLSDAEHVVQELRHAGFTDDTISVLFPDQKLSRDFAHEQNTKAPEGAATGASAGGVVGGALGWMVGVGTLAIPGLGAFIAAGPILAALSGAAVGAAVGGLTGALVGMGIPEYEAKQYEGKIQNGNILISVHVTDAQERDIARETFEKCGAGDVKTTGEAKP